jgi:hypothetical protein
MDLKFRVSAECSLAAKAVFEKLRRARAKLF